MLRRVLSVAVVSVMWLALTPVVAWAGDLEFETDLDPGQETAAVDSDGEGEAEFELKNGLVRFELEWEDLTASAVAAHIHCAVAGVDGGVGVTLFATAQGTDGEVEGSFSGPNAVNSCGWVDLADVVAAMVTGGAYVNVHTPAFPAGEIRGQIEAD